MTSDEDYIRAADRLAREQRVIHDQWRKTALYIAGIACMGFFLYLMVQATISANEPAQERWRACVQERGVDGSYELDERAHPIVLFLTRDAEGQTALAWAPSLAARVGSRQVDPERDAEIEPKSARRVFEQEFGITPEQWLEAWRAGLRPLTATNFRAAYRAMLLEQPLQSD